MDFSKYTQSILKSTHESPVGMSLDMRFDIVEFIKKRLKSSGMTQKSLAAKMKMKDSQLTRIMRAESNITIETVARIYHAFGCRPTIIEKDEVISQAISGDSIYPIGTISIVNPETAIYSAIASSN